MAVEIESGGSAQPPFSEVIAVYNPSGSSSTISAKGKLARGPDRWKLWLTNSLGFRVWHARVYLSIAKTKETRSGGRELDR